MDSKTIETTLEETLVPVPTVYAIKKSPQTFVYEDPLKESSERGI